MVIICVIVDKMSLPQTIFLPYGLDHSHPVSLFHQEPSAFPYVAQPQTEKRIPPSQRLGFSPSYYRDWIGMLSSQKAMDGVLISR